MPVHEVLQALGVLARDRGQRAYLVGGMVRDLAMGQPSVDLDIVVEGDAKGLARAFARRTGSAVRSRTRFGTCKVESRAFGTIDIAAARSESYEFPGALPDVRASGINEDLGRRDFTINAMAVSLVPLDYGGLLDPFGGLDDISRRRLRILHPLSFEDDPTRILRGIRFAVRLGFAFERKTLGLLKACVASGCIRWVSGPRVFGELKLICMEENVVAAIGLLGRYGVLQGIEGRSLSDRCRARDLRKVAASCAGIELMAGEGFIRRWLCWFSALFLGLGRAEALRLASDLSLPRKVREACLWVSADLARTHKKLSRLDRRCPYRVVKLLRTVPPEAMVHLFAISSRRQRDLIALYLKGWRHVAPGLTGHEIVALGADEGPPIGRILEDILKLKLRGKLASQQDEIAYVKRRVARLKAARD